MAEPDTVPPTDLSEELVSTSFTLLPTQVARLKELAAAEHRTMSSMLRVLLDQAFEQFPSKAA